jgi:hypothetical protein
LRLAPVTVAAICGLRLLRLAQRYGVNVFVGDQWFYHEPTLFHRASWWKIFRWESNPWREGLGGLLAAWLEPLFRWNTRIESLIVVWLLIGACFLTLWLKTRVVGPMELWDCLIPLFILTPASYETFVGVVHFSHGPLPILLLIGIALAWTIQNERARYGIVALLTALSVSTGFGFIAGIVVPLILVCEIYWYSDHRTSQLSALGVIGLAWLVFLVGYSTVNAGCPADAFHTHNPFHYFLFVAFMFDNSIGVKANEHLMLAIALGSLLVIAASWALVTAIKHSRKSPIPFLLIAFSLLFAVATSIGRICLGLGVALGSRYVIYLAPAFIGTYLLSYSLRDKAKIRWLTFLALLGIMGAGRVTAGQRISMEAGSRHRREWKSCYLKIHDLSTCNKVTGATILTYPDSIQGKLDFLEAHHLNLFSDEPPTPVLPKKDIKRRVDSNGGSLRLGRKNSLKCSFDFPC